MMEEANENDVGGCAARRDAPPPSEGDDKLAETSELVVDSDEADVEGVQEDAEDESPGHVNGYSNDRESVERGHGDDDGVRQDPHQEQERHPSGVQSPRPSISTRGSSSAAPAAAEEELPPVNIKVIPIGEYRAKSKLRFEVVTARVMDVSGRKHVAYTIMMKRAGGHDPHPAVIERRYSDFCFIYECILRSFHPSILGDFLFPKKVLIGNFKAEVISERTDAFHKFLSLIANCDNLLYSDYFYSFLSSEEHNEAVSHLKLGRFAEATPLLETIFYVREKLLTVASVQVLLCACELVACLSAAGAPAAGALETRKRHEEAYAFAEVAMKSFGLVRQSANPEDVAVAESLRIPFLKTAVQLAAELGQDKKPFERQLSELRYSGVRIDNVPSLLEVIRNRYIHRASHTSKIS